MFVYVSAVCDRDWSSDETTYIACAHLCPFCNHVGNNAIPGFKRSDVCSSMELFLCNMCGAILFLHLKQSLDGYTLTDLAPFQVPEHEAEPRVVEATRLKLAHDKFETILWLKIPVWKVRCSRMCGRGWSCTKRRFAAALCEGDKHTDESDDDEEEDTDRDRDRDRDTDTDDNDDNDDTSEEGKADDSMQAIQWCNSYSLSHPDKPYPATLRHGHMCILPDVLGGDVVHVLLEDPDTRITKVAEFIGHENYRQEKWEKACCERNGVLVEDDSDDEDDDDDDDNNDD